MKKSVLLTATLIGTSLCGNLFAFSEPESEKWDGFRNFKWGIHIADINDPCMVIDPERKTEEDVLICMKKDENLSIGKAELYGIRYYFYKGRLYQIKIVVKGENFYEQLKQSIFIRFGKGKEQFAVGEVYTWGRSMTNGKVVLVLSCSSKNPGMFIMCYVPILKEKEEDKKKNKSEVEQNEKPEDKSETKKWEGFRDLRWNMHIEDVNDPNITGDHPLRYSSVEKNVYYYRKKDEKLLIGDAMLSGISYYFYKDRFYKVEIKPARKYDYETLKRTIFTRFGEGKNKEYAFGGERYTWSPDMTNGNVLMLLTLEEDELMFVGKFTMMYVPILKKMEEDKKKAAKDAARDF